MDRLENAPRSAAADLCWHYRHEAVGPLRSNLGSVIERLARGRARGDATPSEPSDEWLDDATRAGGLARVLRALDPETDDVLWRAFSHEWPDELGTLGDLAGLGPITKAAKRAHQRSGSPKPLAEGLASFLDQPRKAQRHAEVLERFKRDAKDLRIRALTACISQRQRIERLLRLAGVQPRWMGHQKLVWAPDLEAQMPDLWRSLAERSLAPIPGWSFLRGLTSAGGTPSLGARQAD